MLDLLLENVWWLAITSTIISAIIAVIVVLVLMKLPEDHFIAEGQPEPAGHPRAHLAGVLLKNLLGGAILVIGAIMAIPFVPGPGLLLIVVGLSLTNLPGKRRFQLWILRTTLAINAINWLRSLGGRPRFRMPTLVSTVRA